MTLIRVSFFIVLLGFAVNNASAQQKVFYIATKDKQKEASYYFRVMDSIALNCKQDTINTCLNCIKFMEEATGIYASGRVTFFGELEFTRKDLLKWHLWFEEKALKKKAQ